MDSVRLAIVRTKHDEKDIRDIGIAKLDIHRHKRTGAHEVILCIGKTPLQVRRIFTEMIKSQRKQAGQGQMPIIATKAEPRHYAVLRSALGAGNTKHIKYNKTARIIYYMEKPIPRKGRVIVASAGTADMPIAEEAALTAELLGSNVERIYDIGVAGLHRLLGNINKIREANSIVVVAGMEGALASIVAGLVDKPIIAVPTSVGYGANFSGIAPLLTILNSCSPGISVVNIDNGFGAGYNASMINRLVTKNVG
jgi:NCAIR mutase (PurE)-related protein